MPSVTSRKPPRKKLEEVSGFVVVTKQNYLKPLRKKQQGENKQIIQNTEDNCACVPRRNNMAILKENEKVASQLDSKEGIEKKMTELSRARISRANQVIREISPTEEERKEDTLRVQVGSSKMKTINEGIVEEFCTAIKQSNLSTDLKPIGRSEHRNILQIPMKNESYESKKSDKIKAIEGWMKHQGNQIDDSTSHFDKDTENNSEKCFSSQFPLTSFNKEVQHCFQNCMNSSYVKDIFTQSKSARIQECIGAHPKIERVENSANFNASQQDLDSSKYLQFRCNNEGAPVPQISTRLSESDKSTLHKFRKTDLSLTNEIMHDIEPPCNVIRVLPQNCTVQSLKRPEFIKTSCESHVASLDEIENMMELKTDENFSICRKLQGLMPDILQVKLGLENQSKLIEKLDDMMRQSEIGERYPRQRKEDIAIKPNKCFNISTYRQMSGGRMVKTNPQDFSRTDAGIVSQSAVTSQTASKYANHTQTHTHRHTYYNPCQCRSAFKVLTGTPSGKRALGRSRRR